MHTRWHEEDIAGCVLKQIEAGIIKARVLSLPAIAGESDPLGRLPGQYLWHEPGGYNYGGYPMMWSALFQQEPAPEEGDYFKAEWLHTYDQLPPRERLHIYGASDYAVTAGGGDYTVHIIVVLDPEGRMYVVDLWRAQAASECGSRSFAISSCYGSRRPGPRRPARSRAASAPSSNAACASATPSSGGGSSPPRATRQSGHRQSGAAWR